MNNDLQLLDRYSKYLHKLSRLERTGWKLSGIDRAETISEHSFEVALYTMIIIKDLENVDLTKVLVYSLLHDVAEALTGDIPRPKKSREDIEKEREILRKFIEELGLEGVLDKETICGDTIESIIVSISDNLATLLKGIYYYELGYATEYLRDIIINTWSEAYKKASDIGHDTVINFLEKIRHDYTDLFR